MSKKPSTIVIVHNKYDGHADDVAEKCKSYGAKVVSFLIDEYFSSSEINLNISDSEYSLVVNKNSVNLQGKNIRSIYARDFYFPRCPSDSKLPDELMYAEKRAALSGFFKCLKNKFRINSPWAEKFADNKILQMSAAKEIGIKIPKTLVTNNPAEFIKFYECCDEQVVIKQLSEICLIEETETESINEPEIVDEKAYGFYTSKVTSDFIKNIDQIKIAPCMFQEYIPKVADIRSTVIGEEIFSALIKSQDYKESTVDFRKKLDIPMEKYSLPEELKYKLLRFLGIWNLEFAACDFALTEDNELVFFEANVSGNWLWIEDALNFPISKAIAKKLVEEHD